jgi:hypothetical protein
MSDSFDDILSLHLYFRDRMVQGRRSKSLMLDNWEVVGSYEFNICIYKKEFLFSHFSFHISVPCISCYDVTHFLWLYFYDMLNAIISYN